MKNGYTLIEITAVILIIGVIFLVSYPTLENNLKRSEENNNEVDRNNVVLGAKTYFNLHKNTLDFNSPLVVSVSTLVDEGIIEETNLSSKIVTCTYDGKFECEIN